MQSLKTVFSLQAVSGLHTTLVISGCFSSGNVRNFHLGAIAQGVWSPPLLSRGEAPVRDLGAKSPRIRPPEAKAVCRHCLHILTEETIKIWKLCTIHFQYVSVWGLSHCVWVIILSSTISDIMYLNSTCYARTITLESMGYTICHQEPRIFARKPLWSRYIHLIKNLESQTCKELRVLTV